MNIDTCKECCLNSYNTLNSGDNSVNGAAKVNVQHFDKCWYSDTNPKAKYADLVTAYSTEQAETRPNLFNEQPH